MLKRLGLTIAIASMPVAANAENWVRVTGNAFTEMFIDTTMIARVGDGAVSFPYEIRRPAPVAMADGRRFDRTVHYAFARCPERSFRDTHLGVYLGSAVVVPRARITSTLRHTAPGTQERELVEFACSHRLGSEFR